MLRKKLDAGEADLPLVPKVSEALWERRSVPETPFPVAFTSAFCVEFPTNRIPLRLISDGGVTGALVRPAGCNNIGCVSLRAGGKETEFQDSADVPKALR